MGYHTDFTGQVMLAPPLGPDQAAHGPSDPDECSDELKALFQARTGRKFVFAVRDRRIDDVGPAGESGFAPVQERA
jgi:hypothetical protein